MIHVTKTFLPPIEEYNDYLKQIWDSGQVTNQGPLVKKFEESVSDFLGVKNLHFVANGTLALQLALRSLNITEGEIITTPFSYVATTSAILWERCKPVYVDIDPNTLCIDPDKIRQAITKDTKAILAVHVFGNPCDIEAIEQIAKEHAIKVIYDGAHAFGVSYNGKSLFSYGDITVGSFHATKPFHTIEGGCVVAKDKHISDALDLLKRFGHRGDEHYLLGINAKASEFQAAMGLCNLEHIDQITQDRKKVVMKYDSLLHGRVQKPEFPDSATSNYAYYPILFKSEEELLAKTKALKEQNILPRRYFYPSLNTLPYLPQDQECPISEDIARRIVCLPLYAGLDETVINRICEVVAT